MRRLTVHLRELRTSRNPALSQAALAKLAGVRQATISELESGKSRAVTFAVLERLSNVLGVAPGEILVLGPNDGARRRRRNR